MGAGASSSSSSSSYLVGRAGEGSTSSASSPGNGDTTKTRSRIFGSTTVPTTRSVTGGITTASGGKQKQGWTGARVTGPLTAARRYFSNRRQSRVAQRAEAEHQARKAREKREADAELARREVLSG